MTVMGWWGLGQSWTCVRKVDKVIKGKSNSTNCLKLGQGKKKYCRCN